MALTEVRLRPTTPWRVGHGAGDRERVDVVYHSDALYSALTHAMKALGWLSEWIAATAEAEGEPAVRFSSLFPFIGKTKLIAPPKSWWPPANPGRLYTDAAKLIPLEVVRNGIVDESRWVVDGETGCLFHTGSGAPVKIAVRTSAAIDRLTGVADPHRIACLEFSPNAGLWGVYSTNDSTWDARVKSAIRLLCDSGFGGERSRGWGRASAPEFHDAGSLLPWTSNEDGALWLLSLYSPHTSDTVDWSRGEYSTLVRGGWTDSQSGVAPKRQARMLQEGSVLYASALRGRAVDVAPEGFPHPVYRAGFALAIPAPPEPVLRAPQQPEVKVQEPPAIAMENEGGPAVEPELEPLPEIVQPEPQPEPVLPAPEQPEVKVQESPAIAMENEGGPAVEPELEPLPEIVQPEAQSEPGSGIENEGAPAPSEEPQSEEPSEEPQSEEPQ